MIQFYLQAPFAVFRPFTTGTFRSTADFITFSAAYGLLLNIAGIEMRHDDGKSAMTVIKKGLPTVRLALGALEFPRIHSLYQQLHNYPVGNTTGKDHAINTFGRKYNILPVRRQFLSGIRAYICMDSNPDLETWVQEGLAGQRTRYGLPFLGDNNFLIDRLELIKNPEPAYWFVPVKKEDGGFEEHTTSLTITIDRKDMSRTRSKLYVPTRERALTPPAEAWQEVKY